MLNETELRTNWQGKVLPSVERFVAIPPTTRILARVRVLQDHGLTLIASVVYSIATEGQTLEQITARVTPEGFPSHLVSEAFCTLPVLVLIAERLTNHEPLGRIKDLVAEDKIVVEGTETVLPGINIAMDSLANNPHFLLREFRPDDHGFRAVREQLSFLNFSGNRAVIHAAEGSGVNNDAVRKLLKLGAQRYRTFVATLTPNRELTPEEYSREIDSHAQS